jgi:transposase
MSTTCKSPRKVLQVAYAAAKDALPKYAHRFSPKKFTQHQLFACLVFKDFMKTDYRGVIGYLEDCPGLCAVIELARVPHFTTLHKAADRFLRKRPANRLLDSTLAQAKMATLPRRKRRLAAIDSSGFEAQHTSHYFVRRRAQGQKQPKKMTYRRFPKMGIVADCSTHLILSAVPERGPGPDYRHLVRAVEEAHDRRRLSTLLADAGYDAEWVHEFIRAWLTIRSVIPPGAGRPTTKLPTSYWRRLMATQFDKSTYGQRWQVETVFSMIKRRLGAVLGARSYWRQMRALMLKAISHNILIIQRASELFYRAGHSTFLPRVLSLTPRAPVSSPGAPLLRGNGGERVERSRPPSASAFHPAHPARLSRRTPDAPTPSDPFHKPPCALIAPPPRP